MNLEDLLFTDQASLRDVLDLIDKNKFGIAFLQSTGGAVTGSISDGDARRYLLEGGKLGDQALSCVNYSFVWLSDQASREQILKTLDHRVKVVPILDDSGFLVDVYSKHRMPRRNEGSVLARAKSPVRVSFGGGGSDTNHFFLNHGSGAVLNSTVNMFSNATLKLRSDSKVTINSYDLKKSVSVTSLSDLSEGPEEFGLIFSLLNAIKPETGFELSIHSDYPMSSGLGGSAAVLSAISGCFNEFRLDRWNNYEIAELIYEAERLFYNTAGGWQDQYATVFGGFNYMEFRAEQNMISQLRLNKTTICELEASLILCDTTIKHSSGDIHKDQSSGLKNTENVRLVQENVKLCGEMREALLRDNLKCFGENLNLGWEAKKKYSNKISNEHLDKIHSAALNSGASGGKLLGAGGGGFFLFFAPPEKRNSVVMNLEKQNCKIFPFQFEKNGLRSWTLRES